MSIKADGVVGRGDIIKFNPRFIVVREGWNPRKNFGGEEDEELTLSIMAVGVKVPLRCCKAKNDDGKEVVQLIDGERRLRATLEAIHRGADIASVPVIFERNGISEAEALTLALLTNTAKRLTPMEEADAFARLTDWGLEVSEIARKLGKTSSTVRNRLTLRDASPAVRKALDGREITQGEAQEVIRESGGSIARQEELLAKLREQKIAAAQAREEAADPTRIDPVFTDSKDQEGMSPDADEDPDGNDDGSGNFVGPTQAPHIKGGQGVESPRGKRIDYQEAKNLLDQCVKDYEGLLKRKQDGLSLSQAAEERLVWQAGRISVLCHLLEEEEPTGVNDYLG